MQLSRWFLFGIAFLFLAACSNEQQSVPNLSPDQKAILLAPRANAVLGNPNGDVTIVEFFDYQCPYCRKMAPVLAQLAKQDPNIRIVFKEFLLFGPSSEPATRAALAAQMQGKYQEMHDALMASSQPLTEKSVLQIAKNLNLNVTQLHKNMQSTAVNQQIQENNTLADALNLSASPVFIFSPSPTTNQSNTQSFMIVGEASVDNLIQFADKVRR